MAKSEAIPDGLQCALLVDRDRIRVKADYRGQRWRDVVCCGSARKAFTRHIHRSVVGVYALSCVIRGLRHTAPVLLYNSPPAVAQWLFKNKI